MDASTDAGADADADANDVPSDASDVPDGDVATVYFGPGSLLVSGPLPEDVVTRVLQDHAREIASCYRVGAIGLDRTGRVVIDIDVDASGQVTNAIIAHYGLHDGSVGHCALARFRGLRFPVAARSTSVECDFSFDVPYGTEPSRIGPCGCHTGDVDCAIRCARDR
jgi:hypothetical protein